MSFNNSSVGFTIQKIICDRTLIFRLIPSALLKFS